MPDIDDISPGDELPAGTHVLCCGDAMDIGDDTWTCGSCNTVIETRHGLVFTIRD
ncbi:hypothetical protein [Streptomyces racemochromogenes]|uniref:hypothetical protein n=1 Tax=Streptomyces racemochromogenes TaxID=67353 RepID=UPI0031E84B95